MMSKQKFYVVWKGNNPGVYQSWEKCQNEIKNINGALFKSFTNLDEAKKAYDQGYKPQNIFFPQEKHIVSTHLHMD